MPNDIYNLYNLIHPLQTNKPYKININKCINILKNIDSDFNYKNIDFTSWSYITRQLPSNIFDYDNLDIIIHPFYETFHYGYKYQNLFTGDKNYIIYIIPDKYNNNKAELHIVLKDLIYEIDSVVIFILLNILFLQKNKFDNKYKDSIILCKDQMLNGCQRYNCNVYGIKNTLNKLKLNANTLNNTIKYSNILNKISKKSKMTKSKMTKSKMTKSKMTKSKQSINSFNNVNLINNLCDESYSKLYNSKLQKIIKYNNIPQYTITYNSMNYTLAELKLIKIWNKWSYNIYNIIKNHHKDKNTNDTKVNDTKTNDDNFNLHTIVGMKQTSIFLTKLYPKITLSKDDELYDIINNESNIYKKFDLYLKHFIDIKNKYNVDNKLIEILDNFYNENVIKIKNDLNTSCSGIIICLEQYLKNLKKLSNLYDIYYDPIFDKMKNCKNTYILFTNNLFGMNSYYMSNSINNVFKQNLKSMNSIGSCGGSSKNVKLGDFIVSNNINCWSNIINTKINKNIYENMSPYTNSLKNINSYNTYSGKIIKNIENTEDLNYLVNNTKIHFGKTCTVSIIPFETKNLLTLLNENNILGVEMENYWIKKGCPNVNGVYAQYVSDLIGNDEYKFINKQQYSKILYSENLSNSLLRLTLASIIFNCNFTL
jgi:hypothetical protein